MRNKRAVLTSAVLALALSGVAIHSQERAPQGHDHVDDASDSALREIAQRFDEGEHGIVVASVDRFMASHDATLENVPVLFFKAESQYQLGQRQAAIETYQSALARLEVVANNITRRRFVPAYFRLADLFRQQRQFDQAITAVEEGLRLAPQNLEGQIYYGQLLVDGGDPMQALDHYRRQLASPLLVAEQRAVIGIKLDRLAGGRPGASITPPDLSAASIYPGLSIGIVALNSVPPAVSLSDICAILESSWFVACEILRPLSIPEAGILNAQRGQYDADKLLEEIETLMPAGTRRHSHILAITGSDIFAPQTRFVFSWQQRNEAGAIGVLSTSRFTANVPDYYEPEIIGTRRVMLQALSTTGSMLDFTRPTDPQCPLAYPESFEEFQQKRLTLCSSDEQQRDKLLQRRGGKPVAFGAERSDKAAVVYRKYFIE